MVRIIGGAATPSFQRSTTRNTYAVGVEVQLGRARRRQWFNHVIRALLVEIAVHGAATRSAVQPQLEKTSHSARSAYQHNSTHDRSPQRTTKGSVLGSFSVGRTNTQRGEICATRPFGLTRALTGLNQPVMEVLAAGDVQIPSQNDTQQTGEGRAAPRRRRGSGALTPNTALS